jgi:hypothetical protein
MASRKVTITPEIAHAAGRELRLRVGRAEIADWQAERGVLTLQELPGARAEMAAADAEYVGRAS